MIRPTHLLMLLICGGLLVTRPAGSTVEPAGSTVQISCNGNACNLFGTLNYNYIVMNAGGSPVMMTEFYVATNDLDAGSYSNFSSPAGFQVVVGSWKTLNSTYGVVERNTTGTFTDHGLFPDQLGKTPPGAVLFTGGSFTLQPGGTAAFGFNHGWAPHDMNWTIEHPDEQNSSAGALDVAIAGPLETFGFNDGLVHGVGQNTTPVIPTTWGRIKDLLRP